MKKLIDYMKVDEVPELPSRQDELKYLKWLEKSVLSDPWVTLNPSKYMAGPNRLNLKSRKEMRKEYRRTFYLNGLTFMVLTNPIIF